MESHYTHLTTNKLSSRQKHTPIFIFNEHREKHTNIANKTNTHIQAQLDNLQSETLDNKWKKVKVMKKFVILDFLRELNEINEGDSQSENDDF